MHRISHSSVCIHVNKRQNVERSPRALRAWPLVDWTALNRPQCKQRSPIWTEEASQLWFNFILKLQRIFKINKFTVTSVHIPMENPQKCLNMAIKSCITIYFGHFYSTVIFNVQYLMNIHLESQLVDEIKTSTITQYTYVSLTLSCLCQCPAASMVSRGEERPQTVQTAVTGWFSVLSVNQPNPPFQ